MREQGTDRAAANSPMRALLLLLSAWASAALLALVIGVVAVNVSAIPSIPLFGLSGVLWEYVAWIAPVAVLAPGVSLLAGRRREFGWRVAIACGALLGLAWSLLAPRLLPPWVDPFGYALYAGSIASGGGGAGVVRWSRIAPPSALRLAIALGVPVLIWRASVSLSRPVRSILELELREDATIEELVPLLLSLNNPSWEDCRASGCSAMAEGVASVDLPRRPRGYERVRIILAEDVSPNRVHDLERSLAAQRLVVRVSEVRGR